MPLPMKSLEWYLKSKFTGANVKLSFPFFLYMSEMLKNTHQCFCLRDWWLCKGGFILRINPFFTFYVPYEMFPRLLKHFLLLLFFPCIYFSLSCNPCKHMDIYKEIKCISPYYQEGAWWVLMWQNLLIGKNRKSIPFNYAGIFPSCINTHLWI